MQFSIERDEIREIRTLYYMGRMTQKELAQKFNATQPAISAIVNLLTYQDVPPDRLEVSARELFISGELLKRAGHRKPSAAQIAKSDALIKMLRDHTEHHKLFTEHIERVRAAVRKADAEYEKEYGKPPPRPPRGGIYRLPDPKPDSKPDYGDHD